MVPRILIVEDDEQVRSVLRRILEQAGYSVTEAPDGRVGLERWREEPADLLITDLLMPEQDGIETIREVRQGWPDAKIIAYTGGGQTGKSFLPAAQKMGAQRTLEKPLDRQALLTAVHEVLHGIN
jgi:CheY-like chemotaxis protein